jgi:hypothetical protein
MHPALLHWKSRIKKYVAYSKKIFYLQFYMETPQRHQKVYDLKIIQKAVKETFSESGLGLISPICFSCISYSISTFSLEHFDYIKYPKLLKT